ncbi:hypothetical protein RND71_031613 [Anisodus tanguticus]|uniref:Uncharacterized protein n=1 Tax=Anisodus tanguticus TaxID=243964 RepID=A0AAE1RCV5_9SOLA|nr:hypothetical protein RND71_031613 [Anisodus tanguticus]
MISITYFNSLIAENCVDSSCPGNNDQWLCHVSFFLSEVNGLLFGFVACLGASAYVVFLVYLISRRHNQAEFNGFTHLTN